MASNVLDRLDRRAGGRVGLTAPDERYLYNGLRQRAARIAASDATLGYVDEANVYYYDAAWRLLEERVDDGRFAPGTQPSEGDPFDGLTFTADRVVQRVWGFEYIDELLFVMEDDDEDMTDGTPTGRHAVVDRLYSVVGLLDGDAVLLERTRYSAYGVAKQHSVALGDVNGDGVTSAADLNSVNSAFGLTLADANYNADADFDGDGVIDFGNDYNRVLSSFGLQGAPAGQVSNYGNTVGYAGYLFDPATGMCLARFRWYEPEIGRWANRDVMEYADGMSLYQALLSSPGNWCDPLGNAAQPLPPGSRLAGPALRLVGGAASGAAAGAAAATSIGAGAATVAAGALVAGAAYTGYQVGETIGERLFPDIPQAAQPDAATRAERRARRQAAVQQGGVQQTETPECKAAKDAKRRTLQRKASNQTSRRNLPEGDPLSPSRQKFCGKLQDMIDLVNEENRLRNEITSHCYGGTPEPGHLEREASNRREIKNLEDKMKELDCDKFKNPPPLAVPGDGSAGCAA